MLKKPKIHFILFHRKRDFKILKGVGITVIIAAAFIIVKDEIVWQFSSSDGLESEEGIYSDGENCNVAGIALRGELVTYISDESIDAEGAAVISQSSSEDIVFNINNADNSEQIKAILLEIDSLGGGPVAAEEVATALKNAKKPTIALIREYGDSAAYWAATGADIIFASENSEVGGIGVTMSYLDNVRKNEREGFTYQQLSSGKFKDTGTTDKPLTQEERELLLRDVQILHNNFITAVAKNRELDIEIVRKLADGSTMLGAMALQNGLIDRIGDQYAVEEYLKEILGEKAEICWN